MTIMSTSTIIQKNEPVKFLSWLYHRLKNKHNEEDIILNRIADIIHNYQIINQSVSMKYIDQMCNKHFVQFDLDEEFGFDHKFKNELRFLIIDIISDIGAKLSPESNPQIDYNNDTDFVFEPLG